MICVINDIHWGVNGDSEYFLDHYAQFFDKTFFPTLKTRGVTTVVIAGDLWQSRKTINPLTLKKCIDHLFQPMSDAGIRCILLYGNHDVYYKNTNATNTIDFIGRMFKNVEVVDTWKEFKFGNDEVLAMSWLSSEIYEAGLAKLSSTTAKYVIGHFEISGYQMTPGYLCTHGLPPVTFGKFKRAISGHFHVRSDDSKIIYTSNPFQTNWGDWGQEKGFHLFDPATGQLEAINNPIDIYKVISYKDGDKIDAELLAACTDSIVKIRIASYESLEPKALKKFVQAFSDVAYKLVVDARETFDEKSELVVETDGVKMTLRDVMGEYITETAPADMGDDCKSLIFDLYDKAVGVEE